MAVPSTRQEFKAYCLRRLGAPVIEINVDDDQLEDRIDEALKYYADYHFDGSDKVYYSHQITPTDVTNKYITLPENIIGAVRIFEIGASASSSSSLLFDINYQFAMQTMFNISNVQLAPYYIARQNLELIQQILVGQQPIRFSRHRNRLYVDTSWTNKFTVGEYLIVEAYEVIDPQVYTDVWGDRWLARYTTALFKRQWGQHLTKYVGQQLPGGVQFNGEKIYDDAEAEIAKLEEEMLTSYSLPVLDMIG
jgi:hypothetical protein